MASSDDELMVCAEGWVEFNCKFPKTDKVYPSAEVVKDDSQILVSNQNNVWKENGRFSLYRDTINKYLRVAIKQLQPGDTGEYKCKFNSGVGSDSAEESEEVKLKGW